MLIAVASTFGVALLGAVANQVVQRTGDALVPSRDDRGSAVLPSTRPPGLVIDVRWPPDLDLTCDTQVNVAGLPGSPDVEQLPVPPPGELQPDRDPRTVAVDRLGAITWYRGELRLAITAATPEPIYLTRIEPTVFKRQRIVPAWGLEFSPGCGSPAQYRLFQTVLDRGSIRDLGVIGQDSASGGPYKDAPASPLGETFTVTQTDPAELVFHVYACDGYFEWGLKITYIAAGQEHTTTVGTEQQPLKAIGGWRDVPRYHGVYDGRTTVVPGPGLVRGEAPQVPGPPASGSPVCPA